MKFKSLISLALLFSFCGEPGDEVSPEQKKWIFLNRDWKVGSYGVKNCGVQVPEWKDFSVVFYGDDLSSGIFRCTGLPDPVEFPYAPAIWPSRGKWVEWRINYSDTIFSIQRDDSTIVSVNKTSRGGLYLIFNDLEIDSGGRKHTSSCTWNFYLEAGN